MILNPIKWYKAIAAVLKLKKEAKKLMEEAKVEVVVGGEKKPGWKTSEFWLSAIGLAVTVGAAIAPFMPPAALVYVASAGVLIPSVYAIARTIAKQTKSQSDDEFLNKLVEKLKPVIKLEEPK